MGTKIKLERTALPIVLLTVFLDVLGFSVLIPVLPELIYKIFLPAGFTFDQGLVILGWMSAVYPLTQFFATPILGQLSDRYGRRPLLGFSLLGTAIGYVIFACAIVTKNIPLLFVGRAIDGFTGGNISVARAVIADVSAPKHRTRNFGLIGASFGVGFVLGPYIGARLATPNDNIWGLFHTPAWFSAATPFWFAAILSFINTALLVALLPETHRNIDRTLKVVWAKSLGNIMQATRLPGLRTVFASEFFFWGGFTFFTTFFQILLIEKLHFTPSNIGDLFAYLGICIAIFQVTLVPLAAKRLKGHEILRFSIIGTGIALFIQLWPHTEHQLWLVAPLIAIFNGFTVANASSLVSASANKEIQGEVLGIEASVQALAQAIPAAISGYVAAMGVNMPVVVGGIVIIAGGMVFNAFYRAPRAVDRSEAIDLAVAE